MPTPILSSVALVSAGDADPFAQAQMAAAAFLARYSGRTLETYRYDLRTFFQWCADAGLDVLEAKRPHIELWRSTMEERGLAASTIDRRLSTICGFYRFSHIDGRIPSNPAQYARRPKVYPSEGRGLDRGELGRFLFTAERYDPDHAALAALLGLNGLRVSEACATDAEDLGFDRGHHTLLHHREGQQAGCDPAGAQGGADHRPRPRRAIRRTNPAPPRRSAPRPAHGAPLGPLHRQAGRARDCPPPHAAGRLHMAALDAGVPLRDVQIAARHADPRTTTIYDRRRENFDRHAAYVVVAFVAGG